MNFLDECEMDKIIRFVCESFEKPAKIEDKRLALLGMCTYAAREMGKSHEDDVSIAGALIAMAQDFLQECGRL